MSHTTTYVRAPKVLCRRTAAAAVLSRPDHDEVVTLRGSGPMLWDLLAEPISLDEAVDELADLYEVAAEEVRAGVVAALADLTRRGLVEKLSPLEERGQS